MSGKVHGYAGKLLRVDLTTGNVADVQFDEEILQQYLGGTGLGTRILYDEVSPQITWSDPVNRLIIASGPLGGTRIGGSGTISIVTKGALTDGVGAVQGNGLFGALLKFSGYDGIILQGRAPRWQYLCIDENGGEQREAAYLLGKDTYDIADKMKNEEYPTSTLI